MSDDQETFPELVSRESREQSDSIDAELNKSNFIKYVEDSVKGFTNSIDNQRAITPAGSFAAQPAGVTNSPQQFRETSLNNPVGNPSPAIPEQASGTIDVASYDDSTGTYPEEVDNCDKISFTMTDPDVIDHLTVMDFGEGEAMVQFPTTEITGAVNGVPSTNVIVIDGTGWQTI